MAKGRKSQPLLQQYRTMANELTREGGEPNYLILSPELHDQLAREEGGVAPASFSHDHGVTTILRDRTVPVGTATMMSYVPKPAILWWEEEPSESN